MKHCLLLLASVMAAVLCAAESDQIAGLHAVRPDDPRGLLLPRGVPRMVDTNGNVVWIDCLFSTKAYQQAAVSALLQGANQVARELAIPEDLPIIRSNVVEAFVCPFGYNYERQALGTLTTRSYHYSFCKGNKFSQLVVAQYDQACLKLREQRVAIELLNTNEPYQLATQWLRRVSIDVDALDRRCKCSVAVSPYWNGLHEVGEKPHKRFAPIYYVWWDSLEAQRRGGGFVAAVELYLPAKTLLQMDLADPKYILRTPLVVSNLDSLFPGVGKVTLLPPLEPPDPNARFSTR